MNDQTYAHEEIRPLLEAVKFIAHLEQPDSEALDALTARQAARDAFSKWNAAQDRSQPVALPAQSPVAPKRHRPEPLC